MMGVPATKSCNVRGNWVRCILLAVVGDDVDDDVELGREILLWGKMGTRRRRRGHWRLCFKIIWASMSHFVNENFVNIIKSVFVAVSASHFCGIHSQYCIVQYQYGTIPLCIGLLGRRDPQKVRDLGGGRIYGKLKTYAYVRRSVCREVGS